MVNSKEFYCKFFNKTNLITVLYVFSNSLCKPGISWCVKLVGCFFLNSATANFGIHRRQKVQWEGTQVTAWSL